MNQNDTNLTSSYEYLQRILDHSEAGDESSMHQILHFLSDLIFFYRKKHDFPKLNERIQKFFYEDMLIHALKKCSDYLDKEDFIKFSVLCAAVSTYRIRNDHPESTKVFLELINPRRNFKKVIQFTSSDAILLKRNRISCLDKKCYRIEKEQKPFKAKPNYTFPEMLVFFFYDAGGYAEIRNYFCRNKKIEKNIMEIMTFSLKFLSTKYQNFFALELMENLLNTQSDQFFDYGNLLSLLNILVKMSQKKIVLSTYFDCIIKCLTDSKENHEKAKNNFNSFWKENYFFTEIPKKRPEIPGKLPEILEKLPEIFNALLKSYQIEDSIFIKELAVTLSAHKKLCSSEELYKISKGNIFLYLLLFDYLKESFPKKIIDEVFQYFPFNNDTAGFIIKLLKEENFTSETSVNLPQIIIDSLKLNVKDINDDIIEISKKEKTQEVIIESVNMILNGNNFDDIDLLVLLKLITNLWFKKESTNEDEKNDKDKISSSKIIDPKIFNALSEHVLNSINSIEILLCYQNYSFLVIFDLYLFFEMTPNCSLKFEMIQERCISHILEIENEILTIDLLEGNSVNQNSYQNLLFNAYKETNHMQFLLKLLSFDSEALGYLYEKVFTGFQETINKFPNETKKGIISFIQSDLKTKFFLQNLLKFNLTQLEFNADDDMDENLCDDSKAFLALINYTPSDEEIKKILSNDETPSFFQKYVVFLKFFDKSNDIQRIKSYRFGCKVNCLELCEILSNNNICSSLNSFLISVEKTESTNNIIKEIIDECVIYTNRSISILTLQNLLKGNVLVNSYLSNNLSKIIIDLSNSDSCSSDRNFFDDVFKEILLGHISQTEENTKMIYDFFFSSDFPTIFRNSNTTKAVFEFVSKFPTSFFKEIESIKKLPVSFSEIRPSIKPIHLQILSNLPQFISQTQNDEFKELLLCINFPYRRSLSSAKFRESKTIFDVLLFNYAPAFLFELLVFDIDSKLESDIGLKIKPKSSVCESLKFQYSQQPRIITKSPQILIIRFYEAADINKFEVETELDMSSFCIESSLYRLNSVFCTNDSVFLRKSVNEKSFFLKCTENFVTKSDRIDSCISYVVYEKIEQNNSNIFCQKFWLNESKTCRNFSKNETILKCLYFFSSDVFLMFEQTPDFFNVAIHLLTNLKIFPLMHILAKSNEFSRIFFENYISVLKNRDFVKECREDIIHLASLFHDSTILTLLLLDKDELESFSDFEIIFDIIEAIDFNCENRIEIIPDLLEKVILSPSFVKFIENTLNRPDYSADNFKFFLLSNKYVMKPFLSGVNEQQLDQLGFDLVTDEDEFKIILNRFSKQFILSFLKTDPKHEFISLSIDKLYGEKELIDVILDNCADITTEDINKLFDKNNIEGGINVLYKSFPFDSEPNFKVAKMITDCLYKNSQLILPFLPVVKKYKLWFGKSASITNTYTDFLFKHNPNNLQQFDEIRELIKVLPPLGVGMFPQLYISHFQYIGRNDEKIKYIDTYLTIFLDLIVCFYKEASSGKIESDLKVYISIISNKIVDKNYFNEAISSIFLMNNVNNDVFRLDSLIYSISTIPKCLDMVLKRSLIENNENRKYFWENIGFHLFSIAIYELFKYYFHKDKENAPLQDGEVFFSIITSYCEGVDNYVLLPNWPSFSYSVKPPLALLTKIKTKMGKINIKGFRFPVGKMESNLIIRSFYMYLERMSILEHKFLKNFVQYLNNRSFSFYKEYKNDEVQTSFSNLICNIFREMIGDITHINSINSSSYITALQLLFGEFAKVLETMNFSYMTVKPYISIFLAFLKMPIDSPVSISFIKNLKKFPYLFYLVFTRIDSKPDFMNLKILFINIFGKIHPEDKGAKCYNSDILSAFVEKLDAEKDFFKEKIEIFIIIFKRLSTSQKSDVAEKCIDAIEEKLANNKSNTLLQDVLESFIFFICNL